MQCTIDRPHTFFRYSSKSAPCYNEVMGLFWDLIQQSQISQQHSRASSLENRVASLERELAETRQLLSALLQRLEQHFDEDLDRDGSVG